MWKEDFERGMLIGTALMVFNLVFGFAVTLILATPMTSLIAGGGAFLEMGILLLLGGCLMSRQPLKDEGRYQEDGTPTSSWKIALVGRKMIATAIFLFIYAAVIAFLSFIIPF